MKGIQICSNEETHPNPRGDYYEIVKIHLQYLKIFLSRNTGPISTNLGTKHPWVKEIQVYSNEGPRPFPRADNYEIAKIHWQNLIIFFSRTTRPISTKLDTKHPLVKGTQVCSTSNEGPFLGLTGSISTKLCTKHPWVKGIQICSNEEPHPIPKEYNYEIAKIHWQKWKNLLLQNHWTNFN